MMCLAYYIQYCSTVQYLLEVVHTVIYDIYLIYCCVCVCVCVCGCGCVFLLLFLLDCRQLALSTKTTETLPTVVINSKNLIFIRSLTQEIKIIIYTHYYSAQHSLSHFTC